MSKPPTIDVPAIHPRAKRGADKADIARLTAALERIQRLADVRSTDEVDAWSALGGIKYVCASALKGESP